MPQTEESQIICAIRQLRVLRYLSFTHGQFSKQRIARCFPELQQINRLFGRWSAQTWADKMAAHNAILLRGESMRLQVIGRVKRLRFSSLDCYILQMHAEDIAGVLNGLSEFAQRVLPKIQQNRIARTWPICNQILIQRRHWLSFARSVMNLLKLLGFDEPRMNGPLSLSAWLSPWPDFDVLAVAARRAALHFRAFGAADMDDTCI